MTNKMKKIFFISNFLISIFIPNNAFANGSSVNVVSPNQAQNTQTSTGIINQAPFGGSNSNYQINNSYDTTYGFGPGIYCRTSSFNIGLYGDNTNAGSYNYDTYGNNFGLVVGFNIPIGGYIGKSCEDLAEEIAKQRQLDTSLNFIKQCAILKKEGIVFDPEKFPMFKDCDGVTLSKKNDVEIQKPSPIFTPNNGAIPVVPLR
jgi:hypothetical protein